MTSYLIEFSLTSITGGIAGAIASILSAPYKARRDYRREHGG